MSYTCQKCHSFIISDKPCGCLPFKIFGEEFEQEGEIYYGYSFESVVEIIAEEKICQNVFLFNKSIFEHPITVIDKYGITKSFQCTARINYYVEEVKI